MSMPSRAPEVLAAMPGTIVSLVKKTGMSEYSVNRYANMLHADGKCHVGAWRRSGSHPVRCWAAGPGEDAAKPSPSAGKTYSKRSRRKKKELLDRDAAVRAESMAIINATIRRGDPLVNQLFGRAC